MDKKEFIFPFEERDEDTHDPFYRLSVLKKHFEVERLGRDCYALITGPEHHLRFAILEDCGADYDEVYLETVWCGMGIGEGLRELRHSYFGCELDGYVHHIKFETLRLGMEFLSRYFDGD